MKNLVVIAALLVSPFAQAATAPQALPAPVAKAVAQLKSNDVRTVVTKTKGDNPCEMDYNVDIQVKLATYDRIKEKTIYTWTTAKTVSIDKQGRVMEVCAE